MYSLKFCLSVRTARKPSLKYQMENATSLDYDMMGGGLWIHVITEMKEEVKGIVWSSIEDKL